MSSCPVLCIDPSEKLCRNRERCWLLLQMECNHLDTFIGLQRVERPPEPGLNGQRCKLYQISGYLYEGEKCLLGPTTPADLNKLYTPMLYISIKCSGFHRHDLQSILFCLYIMVTLWTIVPWGGKIIPDHKEGDIFIWVMINGALPTNFAFTRMNQFCSLNEQRKDYCKGQFMVPRGPWLLWLYWLTTSYMNVIRIAKSTW